MKRVLFVVGSLILAIVGVVLATRGGTADGTAEAVAASPAEPGPPAFVLPPLVAGKAPPNPYSEERVARGRYLVDYGGCHDCHTPWAYDPALGMPVPDMGRMLSGHPKGAPDPAGAIGAGDMGLIGPTFTSFQMPFGMVYSPNLTPDIDTGIGSWTEQMFVDSVRKGRHMGGAGRPVLPPMPFLNLKSLSDEDLVSVFAYLRSLPPVRNPVPSPKVPEEAMWAIRDGFDKLLGAQAAAGEVVRNAG